jgi:polyisoprenoid-binding protein YceI
MMGKDQNKVAGILNRYVILQVLLCTLLLGTGTATGVQPCAPFEGGVVDPKLVQVMRNAAREGRMFQVVPGASSVGLCVKYLFGEEFRGDVSNIVGGLALPPAPRLHGQALLLIHTNSMTSNDPDLLPLARGPQFLDTSHYPQILFIGRAFQWLNPLQGYIYGDLTLRGKTQPAVFDIDIEVLETGIGDLPVRILLTGNSEVSRRKFGMTSHRLMVSDKVRLCLSVELVAWGR